MDIFGAIILPPTGFFLCLCSTLMCTKLHRSYRFTYISLLLPFTSFSRAGTVSISPLNSQHHVGTWCTGRVLTRCMFKQNCSSFLILFMNKLLRARELWLLQLSSENSKTLLSVDFHKAIKCQAQKTCVCNKNALLLPSLIKASSDTGHEHETKNELTVVYLKAAL